MIKIVLIGAGQIGSRHLQALALLNQPVGISVVDLSDDSLKIARERFEQVNGHLNPNCTIEFYKELEKVSDDIDIAIVATNSKIRKIIIEKLLEIKTVKYFILEKFLFSKVDDYGYVSQLLQKENSKAWVNCPRRTFPFYIELKKSLENKRNIQVSVSGPNWGLGCNGIHMLDLFSFLTGTTDLLLSSEKLDKHIIQSKRDGFVEFTGTIEGVTKRNDIFSITSYAEGTAPLLISVTTDKDRYIIQENTGTIFYSGSSNNWQWETRKIDILYQSKITNVIVEQIVQTGNCGLTEYNQSADLHLKFLKMLIDFSELVENKKVNECLIT